MSAPNFWDNQEEAQKWIGELKFLKSTLDQHDRLKRQCDDELILLEMCDEVKDLSHLEESLRKTRAIQKEMESFELQTFFTGKDDARDVFFSVHSGAGGTDACDFASMLYRMYSRWLNENGYSVSQIDLLDGEEAGIRRVTLEVRGRYPFGFLKSEIGVHRLVRLSPFDTNKKRHTSFVSIDVVPEHEDIQIEISDKDLRVDTYGAGGPGGQHVNKTESAVRITHLPTGVVVQCQNERSQQLNRKVAMRMLQAKLYQVEECKREEEFSKNYGEKGEIAFGSQIRSYVLQPYTLVKDHRTGHETGNIQAILNGEIDPFIEAFLKWKDRTY